MCVYERGHLLYMELYDKLTDNDVRRPYPAYYIYAQEFAIDDDLFLGLDGNSK